MWRGEGRTGLEGNGLMGALGRHLAGGAGPREGWHINMNSGNSLDAVGEQ